MVTLEDLMEMDGMYYVGDLIDMDGSGWVTKEEANKILEEINK